MFTLFSVQLFNFCKDTIFISITNCELRKKKVANHKNNLRLTCLLFWAAFRFCFSDYYLNGVLSIFVNRSGAFRVGCPPTSWTFSFCCHIFIVYLVIYWFVDLVICWWIRDSKDGVGLKSILSILSIIWKGYILQSPQLPIPLPQI